MFTWLINTTTLVATQSTSLLLINFLFEVYYLKYFFVSHVLRSKIFKILRSFRWRHTLYQIEELNKT
jgi:hypothetical protein